MAYSVYGDIQAEFKDLDLTTANAKVTSAKVTEFIVQADAHINALIGKRFTVPVTASASALSVLKMLSIWLVADRVSKIVEIKSASEEANTSNKTLSQKAQEIIDQIVAGDYLLDGATALSSSQGFQSYSNTEDVEYPFHSGTNEW